MDREQRATEAYLSVFEGPWGLKASTEDALLAVINALWPSFPENADGIYAIRNSERLSEICDWTYEYLDCEGMEVNEIVHELLPRLDQAMLTATW